MSERLVDTYTCWKNLQKDRKWSEASGVGCRHMCASKGTCPFGVAKAIKDCANYVPNRVSVLRRKPGFLGLASTYSYYPQTAGVVYTKYDITMVYPGQSYGSEPISIDENQLNETQLVRFSNVESQVYDMDLG